MLFMASKIHSYAECNSAIQQIINLRYEAYCLQSPEIHLLAQMGLDWLRQF
jgi:hypothetical protein